MNIRWLRNYFQGEIMANNNTDQYLENNKKDASGQTIHKPGYPGTGKNPASPGFLFQHLNIIFQTAERGC